MMITEINDIINKNLPAQVGEVLKKHLAECEIVKGLNDKLGVEVRLLNKTIQEKNEHISRLEALDRKHEDLVKREATIVAAETKLELVVMRAHLDAEKASKEAIYRLSEIVFKNPTYTTNTSRSDNTGYHNSNSTTTVEKY
jgi:hypothetical protein